MLHNYKTLLLKINKIFLEIYKDISKKSFTNCLFNVLQKNSNKMQTECRICHEEDTSIKIIPCKCSGSIKYVHEKCLNDYRHISGKMTECSVCSTKYKTTYNYLAIFINFILILVSLMISFAIYVAEYFTIKEIEFLNKFCKKHFEEHSIYSPLLFSGYIYGWFCIIFIYLIILIILIIAIRRNIRLDQLNPKLLVMMFLVDTSCLPLALKNDFASYFSVISGILFFIIITECIFNGLTYRFSRPIRSVTDHDSGNDYDHDSDNDSSHDSYSALV
jgi:hypothetical protein